MEANAATRASEEPDLSRVQWLGLAADTACPHLSREEEEAYADILFKKLVDGRRPVPEDVRPHLVYAMAPQGAGKSSISELLVRYRSEVPIEDYVQFDADAILDLLPVGEEIRHARTIDGRETQVGFAYGWEHCMGVYSNVYDTVLERLIDSRYNLVMQTHFQMSAAIAGDSGYNVTLLYIVVTEETALRRAASRAMRRGRFIRPATRENNWGWSSIVKRYWKQYREQVAWIAGIVDTFVIVLNEEDGVLPGRDDFILLDPHPKIEPPYTWRSVQHGIRREIELAHARAEEIAAARSKV